MSDNNIAYKHLIDAVINLHSENRKHDDPLQDDDYFEFTDEELKRVVEALWSDRYSSDRKNFKNVVASIVSEKVSNE
jgi:hypothetical protein